MSKELAKIETAANEIDRIVIECMPIALQENSNFIDAFKLATGIERLRKAFDMPDIKQMVQSMANTRLGFLTDRPKSSAKGPYQYDQIKEACIEAMLNGYRITGNEFNVIAGNFYPAKNGKYRKILEFEGLTDFIDTYTSPKYEGNGYAKVQCWASWRINGVKQSIGYKDESKEDTCMIQIKVNNFMGDDAIIGKAQSKLYTRVLKRLGFRITEESTDVEFSVKNTQPVDIESQLKSEVLESLSIGELKDMCYKHGEAIVKQACAELGMSQAPADNDVDGWNRLAKFINNAL